MTFYDGDLDIIGGGSFCYRQVDRRTGGQEMKITRKSGKAVTFKDIEQGDYFKDGEMSYIRCEDAENINAVCLSDGELTKFDDYDVVIKAIAEIVEG